MHMSIEEIKRAVAGVARKYGVKKIELFGSYANGKNSRSSDIDLLVDFNDPGLSLFKLFEVEREFAKVLNKKVDIIEMPLSDSSYIKIDKLVPLYG